MKKISWLTTGAILSLAAAAQGQSVQTYFNFNSYGTQSGGATITDATGNTTATVSTVNTSLTAGGLTTTSVSGNSGSTGVALGSGSLSGFTGNFTIQDWVKTSDNTGVVLWGGSSGAANTYIGDGYTGVSSLMGFTWGSLAGGGGTGNPLGQAYNRYGNTVKSYTLTAGSAYDLVLTYDASTYTFSQYINGAFVGSLQEAFSSTSLAGVVSFSVGGAANEPWAPWGDSTSDATTSDFLLINGALTASQVSALDIAGAGASLPTVEAIVPEPGTMALSALGGVGLMLWRRRQAK